MEEQTQVKEESHDEDIHIETKEKDIRIRKWWMVPVLIGSSVLGIIAIIVTLAKTGAFSLISEALK